MVHLEFAQVAEAYIFETIESTAFAAYGFFLTISWERVRNVLKLEAKRVLMDEFDGYQLPNRLPYPAPS
jgi:hypothetical protein